MRNRVVFQIQPPQLYRRQRAGSDAHRADHGRGQAVEALDFSSVVVSEKLSKGVEAVALAEPVAFTAADASVMCDVAPREKEWNPELDDLVPVTDAPGALDCV